MTASVLLAACTSETEAEPTRRQPAPDTATTTTVVTTTTGAAPTSTTAAAPTPEPLTWTKCDDGFECASLDVPVDYQHPDGATLTLAVVRQPAGDQAERIGSLVVNPGGPGGSAIDFVEGSPLPAELTRRFDIVGFDPRGVGRSDQLDCRSHLQEIYDADPTFEDAGDRRAFLDASEAFVHECQADYGKLLAHLGTVNVARDMDQLRAALGEQKLSYLGYSYGTSLGQQYARLFPTRVRAMVLDGVVDPSETGLEAARGQAKGFTGALDAFIADCDQRGCGLDRDAGTVIDQVTAASEKAPIPAPRSDRPAGPGVVSLALAQALYSKSLWPGLARALDDASKGDGDALVALADDYLGRNPDGSYSDGFEIYFAVSCLDASWPRDPQQVFDAAKAVGAEYPRVGEALVNDYARCALWPVAPEPLTPVPSNLAGLAPTVIISTTGDPATPYESGVDVAGRIPGAVLVTNRGEGHTIYGQGKRCVDEPVGRYLLDRAPPPAGLTC